jgi:hypothetical protein
MYELSLSGTSRSVHIVSCTCVFHLRVYESGFHTSSVMEDLLLTSASAKGRRDVSLSAFPRVVHAGKGNSVHTVFYLKLGTEAVNHSPSGCYPSRIHLLYWVQGGGRETLLDKNCEDLLPPLHRDWRGSEEVCSRSKGIKLSFSPSILGA